MLGVHRHGLAVDAVAARAQLAVAVAVLDGHGPRHHAVAHHGHGRHRAARRADAHRVAVGDAQPLGVLPVQRYRVVRMHLAQPRDGNRHGTHQVGLVRGQQQRPLLLAEMRAHGAAVGQSCRIPGGAAAVALARHGVAHAGQLLAPHLQGRRVGLAGVAVLPGVLDAVEAPAARQQHGHLAPFIVLQALAQRGHQPVHAGDGDVVIAGRRHGLAACPGHVGQGVDEEVLGRAQRMGLALGVLDGGLAKAGQAQPFCHGEEEALHVHGLAAGRARHGGLHHGPAHGGAFGHHVGPGRRDAPALVGHGIGHDEIGQRAGLVDEGVDGDDQRQLLRVLEIVHQRVAKARNAVDGVAHVVDPGLGAVGVAGQRAGQHLAGQAAHGRVPRGLGGGVVLRALGLALALALEFRAFLVGLAVA